MSSNDAVRMRIRQELEQPLTGLGLDLEDLELTPAGRRRVLRVAVDRDGGVGSDDLASATRAVSDLLDASDVMGEQPYTLEVTSRGVDRPLTLPRHWRRNTDRLVAVTRTDGSAVTGRVVSAEADPEGVVTLVVEEGPQAGATVRVRYPEVGRALVQVEFNRPDNRDQEGR